MKIRLSQLRRIIKEELEVILDESIAGMQELQTAVRSVYSSVIELPQGEILRIARELNSISRQDITEPEAEKVLEKKLPPVKGLSPKDAAHMLVGMLGLKQKRPVRLR